MRIRKTQTAAAAALALLFSTAVTAGPLGLGGQGDLGGNISGVGSIGVAGAGQAVGDFRPGSDLAGRVDSRTSAAEDRAGAVGDRAFARGYEAAGWGTSVVGPVPSSANAATSAGAAPAGNASLAGSALEANAVSDEATSTADGGISLADADGQPAVPTSAGATTSHSASANGGLSAQPMTSGPATSAQASGSANASASASVSR